MPETKRFTRKKELAYVEFYVDDELFRAVTVAPAMAVLDVAAVESSDGLVKVKLVMEFLDLVLEPDSAERFAERLRSTTNPIEIDQVADVAAWLFEEVYASERPTPAPSPSPNGSGSTGPSTSGTASTEDSTQETSTRRIV